MSLNVGEIKHILKDFPDNYSVEVKDVNDDRSCFVSDDGRSIDDEGKLVLVFEIYPKIEEEEIK